MSIRVNPNVDARTHPYISTGLKDNKFGVAHERTLQTYLRAASLPGLRVVGIDCHIGSQITEDSPYLDAMDRGLQPPDPEPVVPGVPPHVDLSGPPGSAAAD